jgi:hypothetical protein
LRPAAKTLREDSSPGQKGVEHGEKGWMRAQQSITRQLYYPCDMASVPRRTASNLQAIDNIGAKYSHVWLEPGLRLDRLQSITSE